MRSTVEPAGCGRTCRGRRAGKHIKARRHCIAYNEISDGEIPVLCQQPVVVVATSRRAVSVIVIAEMSFCDVSHTQRLCNDGRPPTLYVLNAAAITKAHAIEHLGADLD